MPSLKRAVQRTLNAVLRGDADVLGAITTPHTQAFWLAQTAAQRLRLLRVGEDFAIIEAVQGARTVEVLTQWQPLDGWRCTDVSHTRETIVGKALVGVQELGDPALTAVIAALCDAKAKAAPPAAQALCEPSALRHNPRLLRFFAEPVLFVAPLQAAVGSTHRAVSAIAVTADQMRSIFLAFQHNTTWQLCALTRSERAAAAWLDERVDLRRPLSQRPSCAPLAAWAESPPLPQGALCPQRQRAWRDFLLPPGPQLQRSVTRAVWVAELDYGVASVAFSDALGPLEHRHAIVCGPIHAPTLVDTVTHVDLEAVVHASPDVAAVASNG